MARRLGRSPSSISEELKRNQADGVYGSIKAHRAAEARKRHSHQKYLLPHCPALRDFVLEKLKLGWSPQQISGRLKYKVPKIRAKETSAVQLFLFGQLPKLARKFTTLDNGSEHYLHTR